MSSIQKGYEYDIFISYRQNDNQDGWVTRFVEGLRREIKSIFKREVSIYFDANPKDGLGDTHDVDGSLKEKIKSLIFIPVVSQTYCDPKAFAWQHEFLPFIDHAQHDQFGMDVKLGNGNVAKRVLPVKIYELDPQDKGLFEQHIQGVLRAVDFVYKSAGVNRPLQEHEEHPDDNLERTYYRDQINKVAISIKDLLGSLTADPHIIAHKVAPAVHTTQKKKSLLSLKPKLIGVSTIVVLSIAVSSLLFLGGTSLPFQERNWIVITDFENQTGDPIFDKSLSTAFILSISQSRYINIIDRHRMHQTLNRMKLSDVDHINDLIGREIAVREGAPIYVVPGISRVGSQFTLSTKLHDSSTGELLTSTLVYAENEDEIFEKLDELCEEIRRDLGESRFRIMKNSKPLREVTTSSLNALKQFTLGTEERIKLNTDKAKIHYENANKLDTTFVSAQAALGSLLIQRFDPDEGRKWMDRAMRSIDNLIDIEKYPIQALYASDVEKDLDKAIELTQYILELYPDNAAAHNNLGWWFNQKGEYLLSIEEYKHAIEINPHLMLSYSVLIDIYENHLNEFDSAKILAKRMIEVQPENGWGYFYLASTYVAQDSLELARREFFKARELAPTSINILWRLAHTYRLMGMHDESIEVLNTILKHTPTAKFANYDIGLNYKMNGEFEKANEKFKALKLVCDYWVENYPNNAISYINSGLVLTQLGDIEKGWEMGKKAMEIDSTIYLQMAELLSTQGKKEESLMYLEKALKGGYRNMIWLKLDPYLQPLHDDEAYKGLIRYYSKLDPKG